MGSRFSVTFMKKTQELEWTTHFPGDITDRFLVFVQVSVGFFQASARERCLPRRYFSVRTVKYIFLQIQRMSLTNVFCLIDWLNTKDWLQKSFLSTSKSEDVSRQGERGEPHFVTKSIPRHTTCGEVRTT